MWMIMMAAAVAATPAPAQGRASVDCRVQASGKLADCILRSEAPTGAGVGTFALQLVKTYRISPQDRRVRDGRITIPLKFKMPG